LDFKEFVFVVGIDENVLTEELQRRNNSDLSAIFVFSCRKVRSALDISAVTWTAATWAE